MIEVILILCVIGVMLGFIFGLLKNEKLLKLGKSLACFIFLLFNWATFYYTPVIWSSYVGVIFIGIFAICLLTIWKPFENDKLKIVVLSLVVAMLLVTYFVISFGMYHVSFWEDLKYIAAWEVHLLTLIPAVIAFLFYRKNIIAHRIGTSLAVAVFLFVVGVFAPKLLRNQIYSEVTWRWIILALGVGILLICLLFIWKLFAVKVRRIIALCLLALIIITIGWTVVRVIYINNIFEILERSPEVNLTIYEPFRTDTLAKGLEEPSSLSFNDNLPRLDGATALYPLYAAFARATYPEGEYNVYDWESGINCSRTDGAFRRLMEGETDLIFLMGVSDDMYERTGELGVDLSITPIGREAFVFFVNKQNQVETLTVEDIKDIYSGEVTNWRHFGGEDNKIIAYQRNGTSGSQIMFHQIMDNVPVMYVHEDYIVDTMGKMYNAVAYKNYKNALGFSFRYYINDMIAENEIKFLSINGVAPTIDNIANETYEFSHDFYAVSVVRNHETESAADAERLNNMESFLDWILSPHGQSLVEKTGYVPLR